MGRRNDIDWEAIERDYRAGQLSVREIGTKHGVAASSITRRVEKQAEEGKPWVRDLTAAVQARTKELLHRLPESARPDVENATQRLQADAVHSAVAIEEAATTNVRIVMSHRATIAKARSITEKLLEELDAGAKPGPKARKALLEKRVTMVKSLSEAARIQFGLERQAFNISDGATSTADPLNALLADLLKTKSAVPIAPEEP